jgi:hypothetical protein
MATHALFDVDPFAITIVKRGANRQRIFLKKEHGEPEVTLPTGAILKDGGDDWTTFYCVVAEPGAEEDGGLGAPGIVDENEIRRAAHRFSKNRGYVNAMHGAMAEAGCHVVENAIALTDFDVDGQTIRKGSWYLAIEPTPEFRAMIDSGEVTGVSMEGDGFREALGKATYTNAKKCPGCSGKVALDAGSCPNCRHSFKKGAGTMVHEPTVPPGGPGLFGIKGAQLPAYIQHVFNDLVEKGHAKTSATYRLAVGIVENWAEGHDGKGNKISPSVQVKATAAISEWKALRARAKAQVNKETSNMDDNEKRGLLKQLAIGFGLVKAEDTSGLSEEEKALLDGTSLAKGGTVDDTKPKQEDDVDANERMEKIEKSVETLTGAVGTIAESIAKLAEEKPKEQKPVTADQLRESMQKMAEEFAGQLDRFDEQIDALSAGSSSQKDPEKTPVRKSDNPLAGLLD